MFRTTLAHSMGIIGLATILAAPLAWAQESPPIRVRGTIERVEGPIYVIKARDGAELKLTVADKPSIATLVKASLADIRQDSFVGVTSMPQPDGSLRALEVHIFPEAMRGTGEGHYPWDLRPQSTMTNANSNMVWNTGLSSPGDELITRSTSAVAVCCSSDCRNSLSSRAFSMAMTAWAAKFCTSAICLSLNGRTSWR
jgi:hypothetical protein